MKRGSAFMNKLNTEEEKQNYNDVPVFYCAHCLSLNIRYVKGIDDSEYCDSCGSSNIEQSLIQDWETKYKDKFGHYFLEEY